MVSFSFDFLAFGQMREDLKIIFGSVMIWIEEWSDCHKVLNPSETGLSYIIRYDPQ